MANSNGRLSSSVLAPIPGGRLRKDAAAAWNAMSAESQRRYGVTLRPLGPNSSYRIYATQAYYYRTMRRGMAAYPGTSNHGWGLAVDIASRKMRWIVDQIGAKYGWAKKWSDASHEWWHLKWRAGVWKGQGSRPNPFRVLTPRERKLVGKLKHHRYQMNLHSKTGLGPKYHENRRWAHHYKGLIAKEMKAIQQAARSDNQNWNRYKRAARFRVLAKVYERKL